MKHATSFKTYLIALVLGIGLYSCGAPSSNTPEAAPLVEASTLERDGVPIQVTRYGKEGPALFFVHGWCINQDYWSAQVEALKADYQVVTMNLPGFDGSGKDRKDWSVEAYASDVNAVINGLGLDEVILIGHSMGGDIVLEVALANDKVTALIGVDNFKEVGITYPPEVQAEIEGFMGALRSNFAQTVAGFAQGMLFHPETDSLVRQRVINDFQAADPDIAVAALEGLFDYSGQESEKLSRLGRTLYLINSDATPMAIEGLQASGVDFEVADISGTGHYPMIEKPEVFNSLLKGILAKIGKAQ